jgi:transcriptional regulator GlxA family with amidase domain
LSGKSATTFRQAYADFEMQYPDIHLKRGARFVEDGNLASSDGLSSGIDLAFRVVERFRINVVILVRLHVRLYILSRHQAYIMPLFS